MIRTLLFLILCSITLILNAQTRDLDSLYILKVGENHYRFKLVRGDTSIKHRALVMTEANGAKRWLTMNPQLIDVANNRIKIRMRRATIPYSEEFFIANFHSTQASIDTSQFYNSIDLGEITGTLNKFGDITYKYEFIDEDFLNNVNQEEVRKKFNTLSLDNDFAKWDCENFEDAYLFFLKITWLTEVYDTFTVEEYETLIDLLAPCLGPEYGEGYLEAREWIRFMKWKF